MWLCLSCFQPDPFRKVDLKGRTRTLTGPGMTIFLYRTNLQFAMICISFLEGWTLRIPWLNHKWFRHHRWPARIRILMWGGRPRSNLVWQIHMWGAQDSKMSAKHWSRRKALSQWKYLFVSIENAFGCKCIPFVYMVHAHRSQWCVSMYELYMDHDWSNSWAWTSHPLQGIGSRRSRRRILTVESECRPKMASIQRTPAWTGLIRSCYCSPPTFGPSLVPYVGNFSVFARRITWPIFARGASWACMWLVRAR